MRYLRPASAPKGWFSKWWEPRELLAAVQRSNGRVSLRRFFNDPVQGMRARREAYVAALFSTVLSDHGRCTGVRREPGPFPDFHLRNGKEVLEFEITEADWRGRRRGAEFKAIRRRGPVPYDPAADEEEARQVVPIRVAAKAAKRYGKAPHLLVYVNLSTFARRPDTDVALAASVQPWAPRFASVWLLWGANAIRVAPSLERLTSQSDPFSG
jgi:hypothetical protein